MPLKGNKVYKRVKNMIPQILISISTGLAVAIITYVLLFAIRPKLEIKKYIQIYDKQISFAIINRGQSKAVNIKLEACSVYPIDENLNQTFHFKIDHFDFIMIDTPKGKNDNARRFSIMELSDSALQFNRTYEEIIHDLIHQKSTLRIRFHAVHEISWLGKAFEENFKWDGEKFIKID